MNRYKKGTTDDRPDPEKWAKPYRDKKEMLDREMEKENEYKQELKRVFLMNYINSNKIWLNEDNIFSRGVFFGKGRIS